MFALIMVCTLDFIFFINVSKYLKFHFSSLDLLNRTGSFLVRIYDPSGSDGKSIHRIYDLSGSPEKYKLRSMIQRIFRQSEERGSMIP